MWIFFFFCDSNIEKNGTWLINDKNRRVTWRTVGKHEAAVCGAGAGQLTAAGRKHTCRSAANLGYRRSATVLKARKTDLLASVRAGNDALLHFVKVVEIVVELDYCMGPAKQQRQRKGDYESQLTFRFWCLVEPFMPPSSLPWIFIWTSSRPTSEVLQKQRLTLFTFQICSRQTSALSVSDANDRDVRFYSVPIG